MRPFYGSRKTNLADAAGRQLRDLVGGQLDLPVPANRLGRGRTRFGFPTRKPKARSALTKVPSLNVRADMKSRPWTTALVQKRKVRAVNQ